MYAHIRTHTHAHAGTHTHTHTQTHTHTHTPVAANHTSKVVLQCGKQAPDGAIVCVWRQHSQRAAILEDMVPCITREPISASAPAPVPVPITAEYVRVRSRRGGTCTQMQREKERGIISQWRWRLLPMKVQIPYPPRK